MTHSFPRCHRTDYKVVKFFFRGWGVDPKLGGVTTPTGGLYKSLDRGLVHEVEWSLCGWKFHILGDETSEAIPMSVNELRELGAFSVTPNLILIYWSTNAWKTRSNDGGPWAAVFTISKNYHVYFANSLQAERTDRHIKDSSQANEAIKIICLRVIFIIYLRRFVTRAAYELKLSLRYIMK